VRHVRLCRLLQAKVNFSFVECSLYAFHHIGAKCKRRIGPVCGLETKSKSEFTGQPQDIMGVPDDNVAEAAAIKPALTALAASANVFYKKLQQVRTRLCGVARRALC
jgi:hypothetical protein